MRKIKRGTLDADDVLYPTQRQMTKWVNRTMGLGITLDFWVHDDFARLFNVSQAEARRIARRFHESPEFTSMRPDPEAVAAVERIKAHFDELHVSTSRPSNLHAMTRPAIAAHFHDLFADVHFSNKYEEHLPKQSKAEVSLRLGAEIHGDDVVSHATDCAEAGVIVYLLPFTWNAKATGLHPNIIRVDSLHDIANRLDHQLARRHF